MEQFHGTTIVAVRRGNRVAIGGDGQVTLGNIVVKGTAQKVRRLYQGKILTGFAGSTADAFSLLDRFEAKLEKHQGNLQRAAVELAKDWRTDLLVADPALENPPIGAPARKGDHGVVGDVRGSFDRRVGQGGDQHQLLLEDGRVGKLRSVRRNGHEGRVQRAVGDGGDKRVVRARRELDPDVRKALVERAEHCRQPTGRRALQRAEPQDAARRSLRHRVPGFLRQPEEPVGIGQQHLTARRQVQPLLAAQEELRSNGSLELLDPAGHAGLNAMELARRAHDAALFRNCFEDRKVGKVHSKSRSSGRRAEFARNHDLQPRRARSREFTIQEDRRTLGFCHVQRPLTSAKVADVRQPRSEQVCKICQHSLESPRPSVLAW